MKLAIYFGMIFISILGADLHAKPLLIRMAYEDTALPPYYLGEGEDIPKMPGIAVELVQLLDENMPEIEITLRRAPWKRCQGELQTGFVDAIFPASFKPSRQEIGVYPMHGEAPDESFNLITLSYYLYVLEDEQFSWNGATLSLDGEIGVPTGYSIVSDLRQMNQKVDDTAATTRQNLMKLKDKRVQAVAAQDVTADPLLKTDPLLQDIVRVEPPLRSSSNYLIFSHQFTKAHPELVKRIWTELKQIREEYLDQLELKYE